MIKAKELRVGNIISVPSLNRIGKVISFTERTIKVKLPESKLTSVTHKGLEGLDVNPIPLTEEWLLKLGFERIGKDGFWFNNGVYLDWNIEGFCIAMFHRRVTVKYVHQLQNLCFSLTGEELTIQETIKAA